MKIYAKEDVLASVIILDKTLEVYPEPYRSKGKNEIVVSFDAYRKFVDKYLDVSDYLATDTPHLLAYSRTGMLDELCKCFYKDMALAIAKELWYTNQDATPTRMTHEVDGAYDFGARYVDAISTSCAQQIARAQTDLLSHMEDADYKIQPAKLISFAWEMKYASILYAMASPTNEYGIPFMRWSLERSNQ